MWLFEERVSDALGSLVTEFVTKDAHGQGSLFRPCGTEELLRSLPSTEVLGYFLLSLSGLRTYPTNNQKSRLVLSALWPSVRFKIRVAK